MSKEKIILIGKLIGQKLNYKFISYNKNYTCIDFIFINKEGYKRTLATELYKIKDYLNYIDSDIMKVLFNM